MVFSSLSSPAVFFSAIKIGGFGVALKNPSPWKSVAQLVGRSCGVGHLFFGRFVPLYIRRVFLAENTPKDGRDFFKLYTDIF